MNIILLTATDFTADNKVALSDQRFLQIRDVHRSSVGDSVRVGKLDDLIGEGIIEAIDDKHVALCVTLNQQPPEKLPLTIILALPRPKMLKRIFRTIAELGVKELIVINSYKVEKSFWSSPALEAQKVQQYLISGLQQSRDTMLPRVSFRKRFKPFVEDELPSIINDSMALVAHPNTATACPHSIDKPITLAIGPEGGFSHYEVDKLCSIGFQGIHLGQRILRVENAVPSLVAKLYS